MVVGNEWWVKMVLSKKRKSDSVLKKKKKYNHSKLILAILKPDIAVQTHLERYFVENYVY